ncbi:MAG: anaerobic ribonucleoside-triphosphate reductase activating protein [Deferrisomatales bacterium]|nr:anaerobic ribonucleoside-triphosphate reductase activating protein [Deferrisomatales bacterium]
MVPELKGFLELSFVDWPGRVTAVVFLPRCNFRCPYCHNHPLVLAPEQVATVPLEAVLARLDALRGWVDGVCVTGGEPTLEPRLPELLAVFRSRGLGVKLDTNGSRPAVLASLLAGGLLESVALDVKAPLEPIPYRRNAGAGADPAQVATSLELLARAEIPLEVRTTVHPSLLSQEEVRRLAAQVGAACAVRRGPAAEPVRFTLQRCRGEDLLDGRLKALPPLPPEVFQEWEREARFAFTAAHLDLPPGGEYDL